MRFAVFVCLVCVGGVRVCVVFDCFGEPFFLRCVFGACACVINVLCLCCLCVLLNMLMPNVCGLVALLAVVSFSLCVSGVGLLFCSFCLLLKLVVVVMLLFVLPCVCAVVLYWC